MNEKRLIQKTVKITGCYSDSDQTATKLLLIRVIKRLLQIYLFLDHRTEIKWGAIGAMGTYFVEKIVMVGVIRGGPDTAFRAFLIALVNSKAGIVN